MLFLENIKKTINQYLMLNQNDKVLVAVSGGYDSVALLMALYILKDEYNLKLFCCHINHNLRGIESDEDERYVHRLAEKIKVPFISYSVDTKHKAKEESLSIEQAARILRYDFFKKTADNLKIDKIATAHTADDQAETFFIRLFRGSGLKGLCAIPPKRRLAKAYIIRPMINTSKDDICKFLRNKKIKAREDSSNKSDIFLRNKIRRKLLPYIEKNYSFNIKNIISRTSALLAVDADYIAKKQIQAFRKSAKIKKDKIIIPVNKIKNNHPSVAAGIIRLAIEHLKGDLTQIDYKHLKAVESLMNSDKNKIKICLPGFLIIEKNKNNILFLSDLKNNKTQQVKPAPIVLKIPGTTKIANNKSIELKILQKQPRQFSKIRRIEYFDYDLIKKPLIIRHRHPADKIKPLGMQRYKLIKDIFIDDKICSAKRSTIPIMCDASGKIIWIVGLRISEEFKVTEKTKRSLKAVFI